MARRGLGRSSYADEDFYSSLAAGAGDDSDASDADPKALASSLKGLDDMDDDILGSLSSKKKKGLSQTLPATPVAAKATPAASKAKFSIDDIMGDDAGDDTLDSILKRPKTTDDTKKSTLSSDLFGGSEKPRPATTDQPRKAAKKFDFGEFDEDDPLAGLDLSDDDAPKQKKTTPKASQPVSAEPLQTEVPKPAAAPEPQGHPQSAPADFGKRPATSSGNRPPEKEESLLPIKSRSKPLESGSETGSNWDESSDASDAAKKAQKPKPDTSAKTPSGPKKAVAKKKEEVVFSDDEDDLDLGLDDSPVKPKDQGGGKSGNMMSSLFGRSESVEKHLQRPGTAGSQGSLSLDAKLQPKLDKVDTKKKTADEDDEDVFGSYAPSAMSSRPGTGRSVRFEDEEPEISSKRPATAEGTKTLSDDWLGLGSSASSQKRPLGLASTIDFSGNIDDDDDWLNMASGSSRPKTAPEKVVDKKPPRTPVKRGSTPQKSTDDWLAQLTNEVDSDTEAVLARKPLSRQSSAEKPFSRQSSIDSAGSGSKRPVLAKQKSSDDWLGLGDEVTISKQPIPKQQSKSSAAKPTPAADTSSQREAGGDWLGLSSSPPMKDDDTEAWIRAAKNRRSSQQTDSSIGTRGKELELSASGSFMPSKSKEKADERSLDILRDSAKPAASQKLPWEQESTPKPASAPAAPRQAMISSIFGDDSVSSQPRAAQPEPERQPALPRVSAPQPVFPSMFPMMSETNGQFNNSAWQLEQEHLMQQYQQQMALVQQQYDKTMEIRRQQQQAALQQQKKAMEEAYNLQQQHIQAAVSQVGPSPVFPIGLPPSKQSEIQLNNVELEGKVRRLEHEKSHLESLIASMKQKHQEEVNAIDTNNRSRIAMVEESYQRRELRLREEIEQLNSDNLTKVRLLEDEKASILSAQFRKLDELEQRKSTEVERLREQHHADMAAAKRDHQEALDRLRRSKELEVEALVSSQSNPNTLQFLMEQMKQNAAGLTQMQFNIGKSHQTTLDERDIAMNTRDAQLKALQECLLKQQEENEKERCRLQELLAKMEVQMREQERQLHQERWTVSQEKSKLSALQTAVNQERSLLTDQLTRERSELSRAKDTFLVEQRNAMVQLAEERRLLAEERAQVTVSQRVVSEKESAASLTHSQGSAKYEGLIRALEKEREMLAQRSSALAQNEKTFAADQAILEKEKESVAKEQDRLGELARKIQSETANFEHFSKDCIERESEGRRALAEARSIESANQKRLDEIKSRLEDLKASEKRYAEEQLYLARERKQLESLKSMQLCAGCKQPISNNPYFSLSAPALRNRALPPSVGVVLPQRLDITDPQILQYKIQADQDDSFLNEEVMYLNALKYSPYHKK